MTAPIAGLDCQIHSKTSKPEGGLLEILFRIGFLAK